MGLYNHLCDYSSVPEFMTGMDILRKLAEFFVGSLIWGKKAQFRSPELSLPIKIVKQKVIPYSEKHCKTNAFIKDLKDAGMVVSIMS